MKFKDWLQTRMDERSLNSASLAEAIGENQPTIYRILTGETKNPRLHIINKLETFFNVKYSNDQNSMIDLVNNHDYPSIKRVNLKLSAGISGYGIDYDVDDKTPIVMRKEWFDERGYKPEKLLAVTVKGESMQSGLYDGDTVVINTADNEPSDGDVFAINYEGEMLIKRLLRDAGTWWLSSDNPDQRKYPRKECAGDSCILVGKIIHKQSEQI